MVGQFLAIAFAIQAQIPVHVVTLSGDSILYNNANFRFYSFLDARSDTTKLGFLKESRDASSYQIINFPEGLSPYLSNFIGAVITHTDSPEDVLVVVKSLSLTEEPLGAIEIVKAAIELDFYLAQNGKYRLIKTVATHTELPDKEVTSLLGAQIERVIRTAFYNFLTQPSTEGENNAWLSKSQLRQLVAPPPHKTVAAMGQLDFFQNEYRLNGKEISRKEAIDLLLSTEDAEIEKFLKKRKRGLALGYTFAAGAALLVGVPVTECIVTKSELNGLPLATGGLFAIGSLLSVKTSRYGMHQAVDIYNKRYNN
ncbi:hypothetical protein GC194_05630 [bacterium]|nr:hypothetical protein [bacterium]